MMGASVLPQAAFRTAKPTMLFEKHFWSPILLRNYDVARDGRFVFVKESDQVADAAQIRVVVNWFQELAQKVPVNR